MKHCILALAVLLACLPGLVARADEPADEPAIDWKDAIVLGVVEGATEYLPVSSTGHLILTSYSLGLIEIRESTTETGEPRQELIKSQTLDSFQIVIQIGAIIAVLGLYRKRIEKMLAGLIGRDADGLRLVGMLLLAFAPSAILGPLLHGSIQELLFGPVTVAWALLVGGVVMILANRLYQHRHHNAPIQEITQLTWKGALVIGLFQVLAMWPGTSRSMATILGGLTVGMSMVAAAEFSFLLALPTLGGATVYELLGTGSVLLGEQNLWTLLIGVVVSGIVAAVAVHGFVRWLTRHGLLPFAIYRIIIAAVFLYLLA